MKITILGSQGSGKTTQAMLLSQAMNLPVLDTGDLIRKSCEVVTEENKQACDAIKSGNLVPNDYAANVLKERLEIGDCDKGFILDGYPRLVEQLNFFDPMVDKVVFIRNLESTAFSRLRKRGRADDTEDGIKKRLAWYMEKIAGVLYHYQKQGNLVYVDGEKSVNEVFLEISDKVGL